MVVFVVVDVSFGVVVRSVVGSAVCTCRVVLLPSSGKRRCGPSTLLHLGSVRLQTTMIVRRQCGVVEVNVCPGVVLMRGRVVLLRQHIVVVVVLVWVLWLRIQWRRVPCPLTVGVLCAVSRRLWPLVSVWFAVCQHRSSSRMSGGVVGGGAVVVVEMVWASIVPMIGRLRRLVLPVGVVLRSVGCLGLGCRGSRRVRLRSRLRSRRRCKVFHSLSRLCPKGS